MYCEKLSEQLTVADSHAQSTTSTGSTSFTGTAIDGAEYNRLIAYGIMELSGITATATATWSIQWQASVVSGFTGTATTITTCSGTTASVTASAAVVVGSCEIAGEDVQSARAAEDRYVRAVVTATTDHKKVGVEYLVLADAKRYHPS
jgi:hypothetical protein